MVSLPSTREVAAVAQTVDGHVSAPKPSKRVRARLTLIGAKPFLFHWFGPDAIPLEEGEKTGRAGNDPEEWRKTYLMAPDRHLFVTDAYIFTSLCNGSKFVKVGRGSLLTKVSATLNVEDDHIFLNRWMPEEDLALDKFRNAYHLPVYLDVRSVVNKQTKGRNIRYRVACSPGWVMTCTIWWDPTIVNKANMQSVAHEAGRLVGIGDGRAIGQGRYSVEFEILPDGDA